MSNGYPVTICTGMGFTMHRDEHGFCTPSGRWGHCMLSAVSGSARGRVRASSSRGAPACRADRSTSTSPTTPSGSIEPPSSGSSAKGIPGLSPSRRSSSSGPCRQAGAIAGRRDMRIPPWAAAALAFLAGCSSPPAFRAWKYADVEKRPRRASAPAHPPSPSPRSNCRRPEGQFPESLGPAALRRDNVLAQAREELATPNRRLPGAAPRTRAQPSARRLVPPPRSQRTGLGPHEPCLAQRMGRSRQQEPAMSSTRETI